MTTRYSLTCRCGKIRSVEPSQAGEEFSCTACGTTNEIPTLRHLRELPALEDNAPSRLRKTDWSPLRGTIFLIGVLITLGSMGAMTIFTVSLRHAPTQTSSLPNEKLTFEDLDDLTPQESWLEWQTLRNLPPKIITPHTEEAPPWEFYRQIATGLAIVGLAVTALTWIVRRNS